MSGHICVIVTGSRDWTDTRALIDALREAELRLLGRGAPFDARLIARVLLHGACPTGADEIARRWATAADWIVVPFPAQWEAYSPRSAAGPARNRLMVRTALGLGECGYQVMGVAAPLGASTGTRDCMRAMRFAGIEYLEVT